MQLSNVPFSSLILARMMAEAEVVAHLPNGGSVLVIEVDADTMAHLAVADIAGEDDEDPRDREPDPENGRFVQHEWRPEDYAHRNINEEARQ